MWYGFCIESHTLIMGSGPYQSDELSILDSNDESVSDSPTDICKNWLYN